MSLYLEDKYNTGLGSGGREKHSLFSYFSGPVSRKGAVGKSLDEGQVISRERCREGCGAQALHPLVIDELRDNQQHFQPLCQHHVGPSNGGGTQHHNAQVMTSDAAVNTERIKSHSGVRVPAMVT